MKISKRESQRLERRSQIVAVARRHFFEHGYDGTVMSAIAADLGGSKGTLWSYFPSKEELFAAVVDDTASAIRGAIDISGRGNTPYEQLVNICRSMIDRMTTPIVTQMFRLVSPMAERQPEVGKIFYERGPARSQLMIAEYLRRNFGGLLWTDDYYEAGKDLVALAVANFHFESMWGISGAPGAKEKDERAEKAAMLFIRAYAKEPNVLLALANDEAGLVPKI